MIQMSDRSLNDLTPRQQDIYNEMKEEGLLTQDGKNITPKWIQTQYPSTPIQPRKCKKSQPKTTRKKNKKNKGRK
jgi:hypothetical protein